MPYRSAKPKPGNPNRVPSEVTTEREAQVWDLRQKMMTMAQIAEELGIAPSTVHAILRRVEDRVLAELKEKVERVKARQTAQLEWMLSEAGAAWLESKRNAVTVQTTTEKVDLEGRELEADKTKTVRTVKGQTGDAAYLNTAVSIMASIRKIWGADAKDGETAQANPVEPSVAAAALSAALEAFEAAKARIPDEQA